MKDIKKYFKTKYKPTDPFITIIIHITFILIPSVILREIYLLEESMGYTHLYFRLFLALTIIIVFISITKKHKTIISGIHEQFEIYSLNTGTKKSGSFTLGTGRIEEQDYYIFFKHGEVGYIKDKIKTDNIEIIMRDDIKPSYKEVYVEGELIKCLIVPTNTIKKEYKIN